MNYAGVAYRGHDYNREAVSAFTPVSPLFSCTAQERMPDRDFMDGVLQNPYAPMWTFPGKTKTYKAAKPVRVRIYSEGDYWFVESESLAIAGTGSSREEAINDFSSQIIHFHTYYKKLAPNKVTGDAVRLKRLFETLFLE